MMTTIIAYLALILSIYTLYLVLGIKRQLRTKNSKLVYRYTENGLEIYDETGKNILVKSEHL